MDDFLNIKKKYNTLRENERKKIIDSLASKIDKDGNHLFTKKDGTKYFKKNLYCGGSGKHNYTSNRKLEKKYDLSNHKYIETKYKGQYVFISLQSFDIDPCTKNIHILYDRIGIMFEEDNITKTKENVEVSNAFIKMKTTDWELPLSNKDLNDMIDYIINHFENNN